MEQEELRLEQLRQASSAAAAKDAEPPEDQAPAPPYETPVNVVNPQGGCNCYHYHYSAAVGCQTPVGPPGSIQQANNPEYCTNCFEHGCFCQCPGCRTEWCIAGLTPYKRTCYCPTCVAQDREPPFQRHSYKPSTAAHWAMSTGTLATANVCVNL